VKTPSSTSLAGFRHPACAKLRRPRILPSKYLAYYPGLARILDAGFYLPITRYTYEVVEATVLLVDYDLQVAYDLHVADDLARGLRSLVA
jgi:hypothetical protein